MARKNRRKLGSELGKALIYVKNMGNPEELERICRDDRFRVLETETALVLNEIMKANLEIDVDGKETVDMCAGIEGLKEKAALKGRSEGQAEGREQALQKTAKKLFAKHNSVEDIADTLEVDVEVVEDWLGLVKA